MKCKNFLWLFAATLMTACGAVRPTRDFDASRLPPAPDYSNLNHWAAHPDKADRADMSPSPSLPDLQSGAEVDVLFLHPTSYTGDLHHQRDWNAALSDEKTNRKTDEGTIQYQATIFNGAGRVFAPRYRQAHLHVFYTKKDTADARKAVEIAYQDVLAAFDYYLKHWNKGRPFMIASHSQGALHAMNLIRDRIEGTPLESGLVAAYLIGWPVRENFYKKIKPCESDTEIACFCSWRTWERGFGLRLKKDQQTVCTNPLTWTTTPRAYAPKTLNKGGVIRPFEHIYPQMTDAEVHNGILLAAKPKFKGSFFFRRKNFHIGDLNLYYVNVRENAQARAKAYLKK